MTEKTDKTSTWESFKLDGTAMIEKIKALVHEGNVRRVLIEHDGRTVAEFPLTAGVVGAVLAPAVAAIAAVVALFKDCTIHVERTPDAAPKGSESPAAPGTSARAV
jgi:hypothetical protein